MQKATGCWGSLTRCVYAVWVSYKFHGITQVEEREWSKREIATATNVHLILFADKIEKRTKFAKEINY